MKYVYLGSALLISSVAAWYSIIGLATLFSGAYVPVIIMGIVLELGKIISSSWLFKNWSTAPKFLKAYLLTAILTLMLITSIGIFGYLSKAHIEQTAPSAGIELQISSLDSRAQREQNKITDAEKIIEQLDSQVQALINNQRISGPNGASSLRRSQIKEREELTKTIDEAEKVVQYLQGEKITLQNQVQEIELEVGPIKYVAELFFADNSTENLERAVRYLILLIIFVFDPLAIALIICSNITFSDFGMRSLDSSKIHTIRMKKPKK